MVKYKFEKIILTKSSTIGNFILLLCCRIKRKMKIIDSEKLEKFIHKHADADKAIQKWIEICEAANWKNHSELKNDFLSADYVGNGRYVFNIKGNNYRIVAVVVFFAGRMVIRFIGTHPEYDKIDVKTI
nr:MAG TPA: toxin [Caudoviricetes sp.]